MEPTQTRYPGAQPFSDDALSRAVFFGREREASELTDQIIAHRLVVVYAKSGLGKTSLLHAGVCQPLRDDGYLPLIVRVNDLRRGPMHSVLDGVRAAAQRQQIEYRPGNELSLWHFFKTAEFWRGDLLLIPVLILDQFEELFTLNNPEVRAGFLGKLGYLIRGVSPEISQRPESALSDSADAGQGLTDTPPEIRVVITLREDYVGSLEEAADHIPQILHHRFRLTPLTIEAAASAMVGPTKVHDERLATNPFNYHPEAVEDILDYLSRRRNASVRSFTKFVEPFHLQLICQRVETIVAKRQQQGESSFDFKLSDLGGEKGLKTTLGDFYKSIIRSIEPGRTRGKVRRLCEQYLISPEGRRLSFDESEINRILHLQPDTLRSLVDRRLLRSDQRTDSWYYELSHDSLVEPILLTRKTRGIYLGRLGLLGSILTIFMGVSALFTAPLLMISESVTARDTGEFKFFVPFLFLVYLPIGLSMIWAGVKGFRWSKESLNRYRSARVG